MKKLPFLFNDFFFLLLLLFLFLINFSISGCYIIFAVLLINQVIQIMKKKCLPELPKFYKYFLIYMVFTVISTLFSVDKLNSLIDNKELFTFLLIPLFIIMINSRKKLDYSLYVILVSSTISSLIGIFITLKEWRVDIDHRLKGLTSHWMTYSGLLMLVFIFFFIYFFLLKRKKERILVLVCLVLIFSGIILSLTRSVWIGIFFSLGIFIIYSRPKILYLLIPSIIILIIILPGSIKKRINSIVDLQDASNKDRIHMVYTGIQIFKNHPFTGVGADNIKVVYPMYRHPDAIKNNFHLHNNFLQVLSERGIFALLSLIIAFVSIFINLVQRIQKNVNREKYISVAVFFVFIGFLIGGMFEYNFGDAEIKFILFYFLSIPFLKFQDEKNLERQNHNRKKE